MNFLNSTTASLPELLRNVCTCCLVSTSLSVTAFSQSAENFDDKDQPGKATASDPITKVSAPAEPQPLDTKPSRYAGQDVEPYVASRLAVFSMQSRAIDPFGLYQDPNIKPVRKQAPARLASKRQAALPPTPLADIVKLIQVTTIIPGDKKFLVGTRAFREGEEFPLEFRGKRLELKVLKVTASQIIFQNVKTGEKASNATEVLPPGMMPGGDKMTPPGMVTPDANSPLKLEANNSFAP